MRILCVFGQHNYGDPRRGEGYEYANFVPALRRLGHDVLFLETWDRTRHTDFAPLNRRLLELVESERPDVVLSVMFTYEIWLETWELLRDSGVTGTVNWTPDDSWKYACSSRFLAPAFHAFATTYSSALARYEKDGIRNVLLTQWAANAEALRAPLPAVNCKYPVSFIGTAHGERPRWIRGLGRRGIDVACFGQGWPAGPLAGPEIPEIIRGSVVSLNFSNATRVWEGFGPRHTHQVKARTFEVPGAGGFLLTQWANGLERYYVPDLEIAVFHDVDELATKIRHFLVHTSERDTIAGAGFERTRRDHLYDERLREVLAFALRRRESLEAGQGKRPKTGINWKAFERAAERHHRTRRLALVKALLTAPCSLVWGPTRGERAARRILFELSWRIAGRHTYSAAGWPGRLFYEVS
jgi:spore maturation protein CgeB